MSSCCVIAASLIDACTAQALDDIAATRLVLKVENRARSGAICARNVNALLSGPELREDELYCALLRDPDGHLIWLEAAES